MPVRITMFVFFACAFINANAQKKPPVYSQYIQLAEKIKNDKTLKAVRLESDELVKESDTEVSELIGYYQNNQIKRIAFTGTGTDGATVKNFYFDNGKVFYVRHTWQPSSQNSADRPYSGRYFLKNNQLIYQENNHGHHYESENHDILEMVMNDVKDCQDRLTRKNIQNEFTLTDPTSGLQLSVVNKQYPLLKILVPGQKTGDRGIEVEFPEHVTGFNKKKQGIEHLYLVTRGEDNKRTAPVWKVEKNSFTYETVLNGNVKVVARAQLTPGGVQYTYTISNNSSVEYENLQAVTCVKLYSIFSDTLLERTYVHHKNGFELLASETPERLSMPLKEWIPCRYLVSYTWPVPANKKSKNEEGITYYNKSRKTDEPLIATLSHDQQWIAATFTKETGNLWTNPERTCHHADPSIHLRPGEEKNLTLKTFVLKGKLPDILKLTAGK